MLTQRLTFLFFESSNGFGTTLEHSRAILSLTQWVSVSTHFYFMPQSGNTLDSFHRYLKPLFKPFETSKAEQKHFVMQLLAVTLRDSRSV